MAGDLMAVIWETVDRLGRRVTMDDGAWRHILDEHDEFQHGRLMMSPDDVRLAVEYADEVRRDRLFTCRAIHYRRTEFGEVRYRVVVNYRPSERSGWIGEVITAFLTARKYQDEVQLWP